jgi:uncharacterized repeat protein (TIGR01451 family)
MAHVRAATITNTATLSYQFGGGPQQLDSNTVSFDTTVARTAATAAFLRKLPGSAGAPVPRDAGQCRAADGSLSPIDLPSTPAGFGPQSLLPAVSFANGDPIYISLADADQNLDPAAVEQVEVTVTSSLGDSETILLYETGVDTGVFAGAIPTHDSPPPTPGDCRLLIGSGGSVHVHYTDRQAPTDVVDVEILVDPYGLVFDSLTGAVLEGATVTLIDLATGLPAQVFGDDGVSAYPSSVVSGTAVTDASGRTYPAVPGGFRFPFVRAGQYRLVVQPPVDYSAPSRAPRASLAGLTSPDGRPYVIEDGSFSLPFTLAGPEPVRIDIPVDRTTQVLTLEKIASRADAEAGDFVHYRLRVENRGPVAAGPFSIVDTLPAGMRYKAGSVRSNGAAVTATPDASGRQLTLNLAGAPANGSVEVGYTLVVGPDAIPGNAVNRATAYSGPIAVSNEAVAAVRIRPPFLTDGATIIGRVSEGQCGIDDGVRAGVEGVKLLLEDGTYVVTDRDGRYHFEGVAPGLHVVQVDLSSLPDGYELADCIRNSRRGGRAFSTFVELAGGALWRADWTLRRTRAAAGEAPAPAAKPLDDADASGANTDWLTGQEPGTALLFPAEGHNPRAPAQRVVVKHPPGTKVEARINGTPADPLTFDGALGGAKEGIVVSRWRGLPLKDGRNSIEVDIKDAAGVVSQTLRREVWYTGNAVRAEIVPGASQLVADGRSRPIIAVRFTDAAGHPLHAGSTGRFKLAAPYLPAAEVDAQQERQLAGLDARPTEWRVTGDDGIALIALAPTTQTGTVTLAFEFQSDRSRFTQELQTWLSPGDVDWVIVGYVAGSTGFNTLKDKSRLIDRRQSTSFTDGQANFYAKGKILGKWLMTLAFDDDRKRRRPGEPRQLLRTIDPDRYYTVYGDGSEQRYDAPTSDRLYLKLERRQFYALYGDFETGLNRTELTRYNRTLTGVKTEYQGERFGLNAFAADTGLGFARDEIQGNGLSGPYRLSRRNIVLNSDKVVIEVRDRFQSEIIIERRPQTRHVDYDIDAVSGMLRFRQPVASRDSNLNPQFIVAEYETEGTAKQYLNAGGRAALTLAGGKVEIGGSFLRDADNSGRTDLGGVDVRVKPRADTEIRLEAAASKHNGAVDAKGEAYVAEVEHHGDSVDLLAYFRQQDASFGVGQQNAAEGGTRKYGVDGALRLGETTRITGSAWRQESLIGDADRTAADLRLEQDLGTLDIRAGFRLVDDSNQTGAKRQSRLLTLGASQELFDRKLVIDADAEIALGGKDDSVDFPNRYRLGARYAITDDVRLVVTHEIADGETFSAENTEIGFDIVPWKGARLATTLNQRGIAEAGTRTFAALGLTQNLLVGERWSVDFGFDSNHTLAGAIDPADLVNPAQPAASGGFIGNTLTEDFWALSAGATYRTETLSWTGRAEYRDGDRGDRYGLTTAVLRQTRGGIALAASAQLFRARDIDPVTAKTVKATSGLVRLSGAWRPETSRWSLLDRLDFKLEDVSDGNSALLGFGTGYGGTSRRIVNNLALNRVSRNWTDADGHAHEQRAQLSLYWGAKYVFDRYDGEDYGGFSQVIGVEARRDIGEKLDLGIAASLRHVASGGQTAWSIGPQLGASPFTNAWISVGYNVAGYHDRDFSEDRYTRDGPYVSFRLKFDQLSPEAIFSAGHQRRK